MEILESFISQKIEIKRQRLLIGNCYFFSDSWYSFYFSCVNHEPLYSLLGISNFLSLNH